MKRVTAFLTALALLLVITGCAQPATENTPDTSGSAAGPSSSTSGSDVPAEDGELDLSGVVLRIGAADPSNGQAILEAAGLDDTPYTVEFHVFQGGNLVLEAMAAEQLDIGTGSQIPPISASQGANGGNFRIIATRQASTIHQELVIPAGSDITSVAELAGRRVAYVKNTTAHYFLAKMLEEAGVEWEDVDTIELTTADGLTALLTGEVDALASYGNAIRSAHANGATTLRYAHDILTGDYYWYATPAAIADPLKHAAIVDYLERFHEGNEWTRQNPEAWAAYYAPLVNQTVEQTLKDFVEQNEQTHTQIVAIDETTISSEQDIVDTFARIGVLESSIDASAIYDRSFVEEIGRFADYSK